MNHTDRRHTLDNRKSRVATHEIAETLAEAPRTEHVTNVPNEVLDQFKQYGREVSMQSITYVKVKRWFNQPYIGVITI